MAEAALSFAVNTLGDFLIQKVGFLIGVEEQVERLKNELKYMQSFLKDAAEKQADDERIRMWISDIREVAYDAEDAIEIFVRKVENTRTLLGRWACFPKHLYNLHKVGKEIESILKRLQEIESCRQRYGIQNLGEGTSVLSKRTEDVERGRRLPPWGKDQHLVGVDEAVNTLLDNAIMVEREGLHVAAILGMGGSGKSTLARVIYNHPKVAGRFEYRAWVVASNEFTPEETIKHLILEMHKSTGGWEKVVDKIKKLEETTKDKLMLQQKLQKMLHEHLDGKQYFIIVDDLWERTHWESLRSAFPDEKDKASRLLFTSRSNSIISENEGYVYKMRLLEHDESWNLLLKTVFIGNIPEHVKCSPDFKKIGGEILKKCGGLPLAITVVGGLLMNQAESEPGWKRILKGINSYSGRSGLDNVTAVLELSYHNLPYELKSCFLCLSFFKEDETISAKGLVHIWVAQGLIPQGDGEETMEEIGMSFLDELINRNMVQVMSVKWDDRVSKCQIHDLLRDLSIRKAKEEISFEIIKDQEGDSQSLHKPRHRAMYVGGRYIHSPNQNKHLRSLFVHATGEDMGNLEKSSYWKSFQLLKVLYVDLDEVRKLPGTIGVLSGLKYLKVRGREWDKFPRSLRMLTNLQCLDLGDSIVDSPDVIWKMDSLRHLYSDCIHCEESLKISALKNIQTLKYIDISDSNQLEQITKLTSLCTLGLVISERIDANKLFTSLAKLQNLIHLNISGCGDLLNIEGLGALISITQLKLFGVTLIRLPSASNFPPNLSYLSMTGTSLSEDPMPVLEKLPKLVNLRLKYAYLGDEMVISNDGFPKLKVLIFDSYNHMDLRNIRVGKGAMSKLKRLELIRSSHLKSFAEEMRLKSTDLQVVIRHS